MKHIYQFWINSMEVILILLMHLSCQRHFHVLKAHAGQFYKRPYYPKSHLSTSLGLWKNENDLFNYIAFKKKMHPACLVGLIFSFVSLFYLDSVLLRMAFLWFMFILDEFIQNTKFCRIPNILWPWDCSF